MQKIWWLVFSKVEQEMIPLWSFCMRHKFKYSQSYQFIWAPKGDRKSNEMHSRSRSTVIFSKRRKISTIWSDLCMMPICVFTQYRFDHFTFSMVGQKFLEMKYQSDYSAYIRYWCGLKFWDWHRIISTIPLFKSQPVACFWRLINWKRCFSTNLQKNTF